MPRYSKTYFLIPGTDVFYNTKRVKGGHFYKEDADFFLREAPKNFFTREN